MCLLELFRIGFWNIENRGPQKSPIACFRNEPWANAALIWRECLWSELLYQLSSRRYDGARYWWRPHFSHDRVWFQNKGYENNYELWDHTSLFSVAGHQIVDFQSGIHAYSASKHAVRVLTEGMRRELKEIGSKIKITVSNIAKSYFAIKKIKALLLLNQRNT